MVADRIIIILYVYAFAGFPQIGNGFNGAGFHFHQNHAAVLGVVAHQGLIERILGYVLQVDVERGFDVVAGLRLGFGAVEDGFHAARHPLKQRLAGLAAQVFEKSSNIGIAKLVDKHFAKNPSEYTDQLKKFGLDKPLGFQMAGEARPYVKDPTDKSWSRTSLTTMSIGYELKLAPLQTLALYNAIANGGGKVQPIIVKEIKQADKVLERFEPTVLNPQICSEETLAKMKAMMEGVVSEGTARGIKPKDYTIAGKTGTAWKFKNGQYSKTTYSTSFCGYFPADRPKYSCIVVVDSPKNGRIYGADVAAPVFREVADKCMARDQASQRPLLARVPPRKTPVPLVRAGLQDEIALVCEKMGLAGRTKATGGEEWVRAAFNPETDTAFRARTVALEANPTAARPGRMPDVRGLTLRDALFLLENKGLKVRSAGSGRVREQSLPPGELVQKGAVVSLALQPTAIVTAAVVPVAAPQHIDVAENALLIPAEPEPLGRKPAKTSVKSTSSPKTGRTLGAAKPAASAKTPAATQKTAKPKKSGERLTELKALLRRV